MAASSENTSALLSDQSAGRPCVGRGITSPDCAQEIARSLDPTAGDSIRGWMFARFHVLRSSAFRMGLMFWFLFSLCFSLAEFALYKTLQGRILSAIDQVIVEHFVRAQGAYSEDGLDAVLRAIEPQGRSPMTSSMGFFLANSDGDRIAGNLPICPSEAGWGVHSGADLGLVDDNSSYRFYTGVIGDNVLSLGRSLNAIEDLQEIAISSLFWTTICSMVLAIVAAWFFARRTHMRIAGISTALDRVAGGNLDERLYIGCAGDDLDILSSKINTSLERLKQTVDGMRQVSTDIAHDLKTPLNRLYITIEEAAGKSRKGSCVGQELEGALDEAQAINGTFEALLRIAQIEAGARRSQFKHIDMVNVLETAGEVYMPVVEEHEQELVLDLPDQPLPILGDQSLLLQLIVNLIENAVNHGSTGTKITLSAGESDGSVWFRVADTGPGIPAHEREKVFQRLYRLERSRTTQGTGLGLSLVKAIADLHCSKISLDDNEPGLTFTIRFDKNCPGSDT